MQVKQHYTIEITDLTEEGSGVGRIEDQVVFVSGALPGDTVKAQITQVKKNYALAKIVKVETPSEHRVQPPCPYAFQCGGCAIQHLDYDEQLNQKTSFVKTALERIGGQTDYKLQPIIGMSFPYHYRNKALYPFAVMGGKVVLGFYKPQSHDLVAIDACMIQHPENAAILKVVRDWANDYKISVYRENQHAGLLRHLLIRTTNAGEHMVGLVINGTAIPHTKELVKALTAALPTVRGVLLNTQTKRGNTILGDHFKTIFGESTMIDTIGDFSFELAMPSFFQVNPEQTRVLYQKAMDYCNLSGSEVVWDLYSGAGTITLGLAKHAARVYGNELSAAAVENAKANAIRNGIENVEFIVGAAEDVVPKWLKDHQKPDVVVLDPPRKGADPAVLDAILQMAPERIVYVSCKPSTLARDVKILCENGYQLVEVTPVDMFPHTGHVETVVKLEKY